MLTPKHLFKLFVKAGKAWADDYAPSMGAAISYYTVFSLAPLLVIVVAIAGAVFGRDAVQGVIVAQLSGLMGAQGASLIEGLLASASDTDRGLVAGLVSGVLLLVGATTVFAELQHALDRIWHVPEARKPQGLWAILRARILSFGLILGLVFLLMVSLVVSAGVAAFGSWTGGLMPGSEALLLALNMAVSLSITTLLFAMIYKLMPTIPIAWRDVWVGAFTTALLFEVGQLLIGVYLGKSEMTEPFAAAGSLVAVLVWVYYGAQIFLLGAEFTKAYADEHGSKHAAQAMQATRQTKQAGVPLETPEAGLQPATVIIEHTPRPAYRSPAQRATEAALTATTGKLVYELVGLGVLSIIAAVLTRRRKAMEKSLKWHMKLLQRTRKLTSH